MGPCCSGRGECCLGSVAGFIGRGFIGRQRDCVDGGVGCISRGGGWFKWQGVGGGIVRCI